MRLYDAVALWWMFERRRWDDRLPGAYRRLYCDVCLVIAGRKVRPRAEITRDRPDAEQPPYPDERDLEAAGFALSFLTMCNLYRLRTTRWEMASFYGAVDAAADMEKDYVSPGRPGLVVTAEAGERRLQAMRWGFPPPTGVRSPVVNVRNYSSPFWRSALKNPERRCLVPVTSFQEWSVEPDPETGKKRPHWFTVPSRPIFTFAGVWRPTETGPAFAFLTCGYDGDPSHHLVGAIHPKAVPVILHDEDYDRWLQAPVEDALSLGCAYPSQLLAVD